MKIARLNFFFQLPDDFDGDINDALNEVIKYRKKAGKPRMGESKPMSKEVEDSTTISKRGYDELMFRKFVRLVAEGAKIHGEVNICDYDTGTGNSTPIKKP